VVLQYCRITSFLDHVDVGDTVIEGDLECYSCECSLRRAKYVGCERVYACMRVCLCVCVCVDAVMIFNQAVAWRLSGKFHIAVHNTPNIFVMHACVFVCVCVDAVMIFNQAGAWRLSSNFCIAVHNTPEIFVMHVCVCDAVTMFNQAGAWRLSGNLTGAQAVQQLESGK
jgi:hypothetical protein